MHYSTAARLTRTSARVRWPPTEHHGIGGLSPVLPPEALRGAQSTSGIRAPATLGSIYSRAFCLPLGTTRALDEEEGDRQDDYEARHNPQFGEQLFKFSCAFSLLDLGGDQ
jgi:hypothetical protein